jgi:hypothetical protein
MPTVTSKNRKEFNAAEMAKRTPKMPAGEMADRAWGMSAKNFPSQEAMQAHRQAAKAYRDEGDHAGADRHEAAAMTHVQHMMQSK